MQRPYQYLEIIDGMRLYKGLDINLMQKIYNPMGIFLHYHNQSFSQGLKALKKGHCDILLNAFKSTKRAEFAYFSDRYRYAEDKLYVRADNSSDLYTVDELLSLSNLKKTRLGVVKGYRYTNHRLNEYLAKPVFPQNLVYAKNEKECVEDLLSGRIAVFLQTERPWSCYYGKML